MARRALLGVLVRRDRLPLMCAASLPGRPARALRVRPGAGGHRAQSADAVSRRVPGQARLHRVVRGLPR